MVNKIDVKFEFRPIGQGLFFTGIFRHLLSNHKFSMVYDCGFHPQSTNHEYINYEIEDFYLDVNDNQIDMLVISHFHADHINKTNDLLTKCGGAKTVFLPYLSAEDKLLYSIDNLIDGNGIEDGIVQYFITDPVSFLFDRKVEQICFIHRDGSKEDNIDNPTSPEDLKILDNEMIFKLEIELSKNETLTESNTQVKHYYDSGYISLNKIWLFKFFNKELDSDKREKLQLSIKELLKADKPVNYKEISDALQLKKITFDQIKKTYSKVFSSPEMNDTSLIMLSSPINLEVDIVLCSCKNDFITFNHRRFLCCRNNYHYKSNAKNNSFLLTADIKLNDLCIDEISNWWGENILNKVFMLQVPHHGANNYLSNEAFNSFKNVRYSVINFGLGNMYKHPHQNIISLLLHQQRRNYILNATQVRGVRFIYFLGNRI